MRRNEPLPIVLARPAWNWSPRIRECPHWYPAFETVTELAMNIGVDIVVDPVCPSCQRRLKLVGVAAAHGRQRRVHPRRPVLRTGVGQCKPKSTLQPSVNDRTVVSPDDVYRLYTASIRFFRVKATDFLRVELGIQPLILKQVLHAAATGAYLFDENVLCIATAMRHTPCDMAVMGEVHHHRHSRNRVTQHIEIGMRQMSLVIHVGKFQNSVGIAPDHRQTRFSEVARYRPTVRAEIRLPHRFTSIHRIL